MIVLIVNAPAESGKGTMVKFIEAVFGKSLYTYSSIDYVKEVAKEKFGWDGKKDKKGRNLLSAIKQLMIGYNDLPTKKVVKHIGIAHDMGRDVFQVDIREPDEIEKLVNHCRSSFTECITCRVHNEEAEKNAKKKALSITGDRLYGKYDYDVDIDNNGDFVNLLKEVQEKFKGRFDVEVKIGFNERVFHDIMTCSDINQCEICGHEHIHLNHDKHILSCEFCGQRYRECVEIVRK